MLVLAIADLRMLLRTADIAAAMSVEGQLGTDRVFAAELQAIRPAPRPGAVGRQPDRAAGRLGRRRLPPRAPTATGSRTPTRCAARRRCTAPPATPSSTPRWSPTASSPRPSTTRWCCRTSGRVESNGNFHGAPVAYVLDFLAIVAADVASISERRTDRFLDKARNHGLPPFLAADPGVDSGHMIAQYTQAAIVSELKRLAVPGLGRLDPVVGDAGGPRLDGLVGRPQAAPLGRRPDPGGRDRGAHRRPGARPAGAARAVARHRRRRTRCCATPASRAPAPTATCHPRSRPPSRSSSPAPSLAAAEEVIGELA